MFQIRVSDFDHYILLIGKSSKKLTKYSTFFNHLKAWKVGYVPSISLLKMTVNKTKGLNVKKFLIWHVHFRSLSVVRSYLFV